MRFLTFFALSSFLLACKNTPEQQAQAAARQEAPAPGTVVAEGKIQQSEDGLNRFMFQVTVTKAPERGVYTVTAADGPNQGETQFTLPKGAEDYRVVLRKLPAEKRMAIGFEAPGDTTFYPYYEVVSENKTIRAQYTNAYRFE